MLAVANRDTSLGRVLAQARERAGFSQDEVATLVGQQRPVISNWENGSRRPNAHQLTKLAAIYRASVHELMGGPARERPDFERLVFRDAGDRLDPPAKYEIQRFLSFLDAYGDLLEAMGEAPGMTTSPFSVREGFGGKDDIRRKALDARSLWQLGAGPIGDLATLADLQGITVYLAPLGADLKATVSGAFLPHDKVGYSILINADTTPGRRQFTLAHELGHALFHGEKVYVDYFGRREAIERFASAFAAEFLVPTQGLRAAVEALGIRRIEAPEVVVHLQRLFHVSYAMMLVRIESSGLASPTDIERLRDVHPVPIAERLGYAIAPEEWGQEPPRLGLARFPRRFLRVLRRALEEDKASISSAAAIMGCAEEEVEDFFFDGTPPGDGTGETRTAEEFEYIRAS